jgi:hypothetical protein
MSNPTRKLQLGGGTLTGQLNFSGTNHAGLKLLSLTTVQRDALTPANGMLIYNTTLSKAQKYVGGSWSNIGDSSIDLYRENATALSAPSASGANAFCLGSGASAAADYSLAIGEGAACTGSANQVAVGYGATTSGANATSVGISSTAGTNATALGSGNTASGTNSFAAGSASQATNSLAHAIGYLCKADQSGEVAFSTAAFSAAGDFKETNRFAVATTSNATPSDSTFALGNNSTLSFLAKVTARRTDADGENDGWEFKGLIHRDANAASTTLDALQVNQIGATGWTADITADTSGGGVKVTLTGEAAKTIRWGIILTGCYISE